MKSGILAHLYRISTQDTKKPPAPQVPPEVQACFERKLKTVYNKKNKVHQVYFSTFKYVPEKQKSVDKRTYVGQIKNGEFSYTKTQLLEQKKKELEEHIKSSGTLGNSTDVNPTAINQTEINPTENNPAGNDLADDIANNETNATKGVEAVIAKAQKAIPDERQQSKAVYPVKYVFLVSLLSALGGRSGCVQIADYWCANRKVLAKLFPDFPDVDISHDTVRRLLMLVDPSHLSELYRKLVGPLVAETAGRIVSVDGQAIKATGRGRKQHRCRYMLSFYDTDNGVVMGQKLVDRKTNESTVAPVLLDELDIDGTIVTCDALNTKPEFANKIVEKRADHCMAVKDNRKKLHIEIQLAFLDKMETETKTFSETETGHGRIETRTVQVLPASRLPEEMARPWIGLDEGSIVKATTDSYDKVNGIESTLDRYFITTLRFDDPAIAAQCARAVRHHWRVENELHYIMDFDMNQDRCQCKNAVYLENRVRINHLSHAIINQVRKNNPEPSGALKSRKRIMEALGNITFALEQLGRIYAN